MKFVLPLLLLVTVTACSRRTLTSAARTLRAVLEFSESGPFSLGAQPISGNAEKTITIRNSGGAAASEIKIEIQNSLGSPFSLKSNSCPFSTGSFLAVGGTCEVTVTFRPSAVGSASNVLLVSYGNAYSTSTISASLSGTGLAQPIGFLEFLDLPPYSFGSVAVNSVVEHVFIVRNSGVAPVSNMQIQLQNNNVFAVKSHTCPAAPSTLLATGGTCSVTIEFRPTAVAQVSNNILINYHNGQGGTSTSEQITGVGLGQPTGHLAISNPSLDFGSVELGGSSTRILTLSNDGAANISLTSFSFISNFSLTNVGVPCSVGLVLTPGALCNLGISFTPAVPSGTPLPLPVNGSVQISYHNGSSGVSAACVLSGTLLAPSNALVAINGTSPSNFQDVPLNSATPPKACITVANTGSVNVSSLQPMLINSPFSYTSGMSCQLPACATTLPAGSSCSYVIEFDPVSSGDFSGPISVSYLYNGIQGNAQGTLSGKAIASSCHEIHASNPSAPNGEYSIRPNPLLPSMQAYCDMQTDGGGWTLILNYLHLGNTNPKHTIRSSNLPLRGSEALGVDESSTSGGIYWGHATPQLVDALAPNEVRFYCRSADHNRTLHFKTSHNGVVSYVLTGSGSMAGIHSSFSPLPGHNAFLPNIAEVDFSPYGNNKGNLAITEFSFFEDSGQHWSIKSKDSEYPNWWECDSYVQGPAKSTYHQVWVR